MSTAGQRSRDYELGHSEWELARLASQARLIDPMTRDYFERAGIRPGMRVLDVGSGAGDVAFLVADVIGGDGEIVGTDLSPEAVAAASRRARERGIPNVSFRQGDPRALSFDAPFDAAVGRYVLMFCDDPAAMLKGIVRHLVPTGGIVVFHEVDLTGFRSVPPAPIYDRCCSYVARTFLKVGTDPSMGTRLYRAFIDAGLPPPEMGIQSLVGGRHGPRNGADLVANLVITMAPVMEECGVTTVEDLDLPTLHARMLAEIEAHESVIFGRLEVGAWSRRI